MSDVIERAAYPEDVMKVAREVVIGIHPVHVDKIRGGSYDDAPSIHTAARAILAERARAAKVADASAARYRREAAQCREEGQNTSETWAEGLAIALETTAAAIRKGEAS